MKDAPCVASDICKVWQRIKIEQVLNNPLEVMLNNIVHFIQRIIPIGGQ